MLLTRDLNRNFSPCVHHFQSTTSHTGLLRAVTLTAGFGIPIFLTKTIDAVSICVKVTYDSNIPFRWFVCLSVRYNAKRYHPRDKFRLTDSTAHLPPWTISDTNHSGQSAIPTTAPSQELPCQNYPITFCVHHIYVEFSYASSIESVNS